MKIVYCIDSISHWGGIQKITVVKANALAEITGNKVWICVSDFRDNELSKKLNPKVNLINLNINYYQDDRKSKWHLLIASTIKRLEHKRILASYLYKINPDIVISVGTSEKYFMPEIKGLWKTIREIHSVSDYRLYRTGGKIQRILAKIITLYDLKLKIKNYDQIVILTNEDKERNWKDYSRIKVIPNPLTFSPSHCTKEREKKIISMGRLEPEKNYSSLIRAFKRVSEKHSDWKLELWGDGTQRDILSELIIELNLSDKAFIKGPTSNPQIEMEKASIFVSTSKYEGFPLVMIEAMSCGLPVVSYDCPTGPKEIITEGTDGFLVPINNEKILTDKICFLIENHEFRRAASKAAYKKTRNYTLDKIIPLWTEVFKELIINN